jgi:hypothetical protein
MKKEFDASLMNELSRYPIPETDFSIVEYSYNGKPPRVKVVQEWKGASGKGGETVLMKGVEKGELKAIATALIVYIDNPAKQKVALKRRVTRVA